MSGMVTDFLVVADQIFILVLLIAAGYVAVATKIVDPGPPGDSPDSSSTSPCRH